VYGPDCELTAAAARTERRSHDWASCFRNARRSDPCFDAGFEAQQHRSHRGFCVTQTRGASGETTRSDSQRGAVALKTPPRRPRDTEGGASSCQPVSSARRRAGLCIADLLLPCFQPLCWPSPVCGLHLHYPLTLDTTMTGLRVAVWCMTAVAVATALAAGLTSAATVAPLSTTARQAGCGVSGTTCVLAVAESFHRHMSARRNHDVVVFRNVTTMPLDGDAGAATTARLGWSCHEVLDQGRDTGIFECFAAGDVAMACAGNPPRVPRSASEVCYTQDYLSFTREELAVFGPMPGPPMLPNESGMPCATANE